MSKAAKSEDTSAKKKKGKLPLIVGLVVSSPVAGEARTGGSRCKRPPLPVPKTPGGIGEKGEKGEKGEGGDHAEAARKEARCCRSTSSR